MDGSAGGGSNNSSDFVSGPGAMRCVAAAC